MRGCGGRREKGTDSTECPQEPGTGWVLCILSHLRLTVILELGTIIISHFIDEGIETESSKDLPKGHEVRVQSQNLNLHPEVGT